MTKKEAVYSSVWDIYVSGKDLGMIRMGEIAEASGIPKGTIYEYFRSKDQLIAESVGWALEREANGLLEMVDRAAGFDNKWEMILQWVKSPAARAIFMTDLTGAEKIPEKLREEFINFKKQNCYNGDIITRLMDILVKAGVEDGTLEWEGTLFIRRTAGFSAFSPVLMYDRLPEEFIDMTWEETKAYSRRLFISAFRKS